MIMAAAAGAHATSPQPFPGQRSQTCSSSASTPAKNGFSDDKNEETTLRAMAMFTAVLGVLFCGFTAAAVLSDENYLRATEISPPYNVDFFKFWKAVIVVDGVLLILGVVGSRRMWLVGSGTLCPLVFTCGFASSNHFFILKTLIGLLLAVLLATSLRFLSWSIRTPRLVKNGVIIGPAAALVIVPLFARFFGAGLSVVFPWQSAFSIIAGTEGVLFFFSIFDLPPDAKSQAVLSSSSLFQPSLTNFWIYMANFIFFLGQLFYSFG
jgi:hypothetical protein